MNGPKLTVIIPCFNEKKTILEVLARVEALPIDKSVVVVDNHSTDGTRELLTSLTTASTDRQADLPVEDELRLVGQQIRTAKSSVVIFQPRNLCKGTSVKTGLALAKGQYVICQDADLEYDPSDIVRLLEHAENTKADAVFGSRLLGRQRPSMGLYQMGRSGLTAMFRGLYGGALTDVATCYKLMKTSVARSLRLRSSGFDLDFEIPAKLFRLGYRVTELPISYRPRTVAEGKKIALRDGATAMWSLLRYRVVPVQPDHLGARRAPEKSAARSSSAMLAHPMTAKATSSSERKISTTRATPATPDHANRAGR